MQWYNVNSVSIQVVVLLTLIDKAKQRADTYHLRNCAYNKNAVPFSRHGCVQAGRSFYRTLMNIVKWTHFNIFQVTLLTH